MRFILIASIVALTTSLLELHNRLAVTSDQLQKICADHVPVGSSKDLQKALVCGIDLENSSPWKKMFIQTGLIHVIVVSGTHFLTLILLLNLFIKGRLQSFAIFFVLTAYALVTGLQPPAIRSLLTILLSWFFFKLKIPHNSLQILTASVVLCFGFDSQWTTSLSLILSAYAGLALCLPTHEQSKASLFEKQTHFFILLMPVLATFQYLNPIQFLANIAFAPFLSLVLFPMAIAGIIVSPLNFIFEQTAKASFFVLSQLQPLIPEAMPNKSENHFFALWIIWIAIWIVLDFKTKKRARLQWHF
jgi:ComEC/Rec2-related protein